MQTEFPVESYFRDPEMPFQASDTVFSFSQLSAFYDAPGEFGHFLEGRIYGFEALSLIVTETYPGGGPPLHAHECEEAYVLTEGKLRCIQGDRRFECTAPCIVKIPAGVPHTFVNAGSQPLRVVAVLPSGQFSYNELGPNPLIGT